MRKNFGAKPFLFPQPVLIIAAYDEKGVPNAMNAAWGMMCDMNKVALCVSSGHKTIKNIFAVKEFTVSTATAPQVIACDYVGIATGNKVQNKFEKAGFNATKSEFVNAPIIEELPLALECKLIKYDEETGLLFGEIVNVSVDDSVLDDDGNVDVEKYKPIVIDPMNNAYLQIGQKVGNAFSDGKKLFD